MDLSVVIPIKDERDNLRPLHERLRRVLDPLGLSYEIVFVDDGSTDGSATVMQELAADPRVKVVQLRRNFGQTAALQAGIDWSCGDVLVTMDGDLQNDPADIPRLLDKLAEGYDAVLGLRANRQDHLFVRKIPSLLGNWLIRQVTGVSIKDMGCTLRAMRRDLAEALPLYGEMHRFVPVLAQQYGGRLIQIPVQHHPRTAGKTKYNLTAHLPRCSRSDHGEVPAQLSDSPHARAGTGRPCLDVSRRRMPAGDNGHEVHSGIFMTGNPLLLLSVMLELVGIQFILMGLLGELMTRTYFESQGKKSYSVRNTLNLEQGTRRKAA